MNIELTLDSNDSAYDTWSSSYAVEPKTGHHAAVFAQGSAAIPLTKSVEPMPPNTGTTRKTDRTAENRKIKPMGASGEATIKFENDPKEGWKASASASAKYEDKKGNYGKIEASKEKDGKGSVKISAGKNDGKK